MRMIRDGELSDGVGAEGLDVEALKALAGKPAIYHCMSRVVDRQFLFGEVAKEQFVHYMRLYERFCQVRVLAFCVMANHFHLLIEVPARPEDGGQSWSDERFLAHLRILYSGRKVLEISRKLAELRAGGHDGAAEEVRRSFFYRMWDLSEFMKTLKQRFTRWFNKQHGRRGTLWEERFKSTLVESGLGARTVTGYIDLNPVRAGLVSRPETYRWNSFGAAVAGSSRAREGLQRVLYEREIDAAPVTDASEFLTDWPAAQKLYHELLHADLRRAEHDQERSMAEAPSITGCDALRHRVRHYTDGLVIGTKRFVNRVFGLSRSHFGPKRRSGARPIRGVATTLCSMRDLRS